MKKIKIAFFDIDGTLIDMETKRITERTLTALRQLKENGVLLCIATGRPLKSVPQFPGVAFDAFLTFNGSYSCTQKELIYKNPIPMEDVDRIIKNAAALHRPVAIATAERIAANGKDQDLVEYFAISKQFVEVADDFEQLKQQEVYQIMLGCRKDEYAELLKGVTGAKITAWWDRAADIIPSDGGKGAAVERVLSYYEIKKEEAIAFGDGTNDIEMLKAVGTGVAMGNASEDVKQAAKLICGKVSEDGIYFFCLKHHLIG